MFITVLVVSWSVTGWIAVRDHKRIEKLESQIELYNREVVTQHNVTIVRRLPNLDFAFISDEKPLGDTFRPCPSDLDNGLQVDQLLTQGIGVTADVAKWEERGTCKSILRADLGFDFINAHNNWEYRRIGGGNE